jgi:serine protein kinase
MPSSDPSGRSLDALTEAVRSDFVRNRRVMSFAEYLDLVARAPRLQLRSAAQYLVDAFDHYGTREVSYPWGQVQRFGLFDAPWAGGDGCLFGQEAVQNSVYQVLRGFVRDGVASKVVMLHGPNGSAKSTFIRCLGRGVEHYSTQDDGAIYRFNWIFPRPSAGQGRHRLRRRRRGGPALTDSFASLADDRHRRAPGRRAA